MFKVLHLADIHARDKDIEEIRKCLGHIIDIAYVERPDVIIIAGDTFDSQNIKLDSASAKFIFRAVRQLAEVAPVAVLIGTPSHDGQAAEVLSYINSTYPVIVSQKPEQLYVWANGDIFTTPPKDHAPHAILSMIPAPTKQFFRSEGKSIKEADQDIAKAMSAIFAGFGANAAQYHCPHILVGHWNTTGAFVSETQILTGVDIEISRDQMLLAEADVTCLGHIHKAQDMGNNIYYSGSIYRKDFGELDDKGFYIHEIDDISDEEVKSRFIETPTRKLIKFENNFATDDGVPENLMELMAPDQDITGAHVRIELKVWQDEANQIDKAAIETEIKKTAAEAEVKLIRVPRENVRSKRLLSLPTLREKVAEMAEIKSQPLSDTILEKAELLESTDPGDLIKQLAEGADETTDTGNIAEAA